ncbi:MAG: hypothetical protein KDA58_14905 [Planctomycetaceae bacterium]|nr:hypothetical protein [Planctomycetaceae bacterium]
MWSRNVETLQLCRGRVTLDDSPGWSVYRGQSVGGDGSIPEISGYELRSLSSMGVKKSGKGRRKLGRKKRRMRAKIRHRKG